MVSSNNNRQNGRDGFACVVSGSKRCQKRLTSDKKRAHLLIKSPQFLVLVGYRHALQILVVSDSLKISADQERVDFVGILRFKLLDVAVDRVELAMAASFYCDLGVL